MTQRAGFKQDIRILYTGHLILWILVLALWIWPEDNFEKRMDRLQFYSYEVDKNTDDIYNHRHMYKDGKVYLNSYFDHWGRQLEK